MANLKELKNRINSVKATQKITKAMQMVAASKLRRARARAEAAQPYAEKMESIVASLATQAKNTNGSSPLLVGNGKSDNHLIIVATSNKGLCGGFNSSIVKLVRNKITELEGQGKQVFLYCVGKKGRELLQMQFGERIVAFDEETCQKEPQYANACTIASDVLSRFDTSDFDVCSIVYNRFKSVLVQEPTYQQLIPLDVESLAEEGDEAPLLAAQEYEPSEEVILEDLLPRNIQVQIYHALLENAASEQGARMSAMDNATRNAGEMIKKLSLTYNRTRQAAITTELIEIIAGAEAL